MRRFIANWGPVIIAVSIAAAIAPSYGDRYGRK